MFSINVLNRVFLCFSFNYALYPSLRLYKDFSTKDILSHVVAFIQIKKRVGAGKVEFKEFERRLRDIAKV